MKRISGAERQSKLCKKCGVVKSRAEYTIRNSGARSGQLLAYCKECCAAASVIYRAANPEKVKDYNGTYRSARSAVDPAWHKRYDRARYAADPIGERARGQRWRAANPERTAAAKRAWYEKHSARERARVKAWRGANREQMRHQILARRARRFGNGGSHTLAQWREKCELYLNRCAYCGEARKLTRDHKTPLSCGGTDDIRNIIPACRSCNSRKQRKTAHEFAALMVSKNITAGVFHPA